jgi:hypothetical protein
VLQRHEKEIKENMFLGMRGTWGENRKKIKGKT